MPDSETTKRQKLDLLEEILNLSAELVRSENVSRLNHQDLKHVRNAMRTALREMKG